MKSVKHVTSRTFVALLCVLFFTCEEAFPKYALTYLPNNNSSEDKCGCGEEGSGKPRWLQLALSGGSISLAAERFRAAKIEKVGTKITAEGPLENLQMACQPKPCCLRSGSWQNKITVTQSEDGIDGAFMVEISDRCGPPLEFVARCSCTFPFHGSRTIW